MTLLAPQPVELTRKACRAHGAGEETGCGTDRESDQHDEDERRLPAPPVIELERDELGVLQRQEEQREKDRAPDYPAQ